MQQVDILALTRLQLLVPDYDVDTFDRNATWVNINTTVLVWLMSAGHTELVHHVLKKDAVAVLAPGMLAGAAAHGHFGVFRQLLARGCPVDRGVLHACIRAGNVNATAAVCLRDPNLCDVGALALAVQLDHVGVAGALLAAMPALPELAVCGWTRNVRMLRQFVDAGMAPTVADTLRYITSPLDFLDALFELGFPLGDACFTVACRKRDEPLFWWLFEHRCPIPDTLAELVRDWPEVQRSHAAKVN